MNASVPLCRTPPPRRASRPLTAAAARLRIQGLEAEREALWQRIYYLERLGQAGLMAGGLAHDAQNMLAGISGHCQLALAANDAASQRESVEIAVGLATKAGRAMRTFLTFVRDDPEGPAPASRVDEVARDAVGFVASLTRRAGVAVTQEVEPGLRVRCAPTLLLQALVNLLSNATRAIGTEGGHVRIHARRAGGEAVISIEDDGPGIDPRIAPRLFEPFMTGCRDEGGTGLGLFITRRILQQQGGRIDFESTPGVGTTFDIHLPLPATCGHGAPETQE